MSVYLALHFVYLPSWWINISIIIIIIIINECVLCQSVTEVPDIEDPNADRFVLHIACNFTVYSTKCNFFRGQELWKIWTPVTLGPPSDCLDTIIDRFGGVRPISVVAVFLSSVVTAVIWWPPSPTVTALWGPGTLWVLGDRVFQTLKQNIASLNKFNRNCGSVRHIFDYSFMT